MKNLYDIFLQYLMPNMIDLSKYPHTEEAFYYVFTALSIFIVLYIFVWLPFSFIRCIARGGKRSKGRFLK
ncbi:MAG: hypothetical protein RSB59_05840 [Clostridia bacterium]